MNIETVAHHLPPLDPDAPVQPAPAVDEYLAYYNIDFRDRIEGLVQQVGTVPSGHFDLVCQLFRHPRPRGTCFVVHGYFDHVGLYGRLIGHLLERGFSVVAFDLPGHGLSTGEEAHISTFRHYDRALESCMRLCVNRLPEPWCAIGQSTGGAAILTFLLTEPRHPFERVVLLAPLVRPYGWRWLRLLHTVLSPFLEHLPRAFTHNTSDREFVKFLKHHDPLQSRKLKVRWITAMRRWYKWVLQQEPAKDRILIIQGDADTTVDWPFNLAQMRRLFPNAHVVTLGGGRHHLVNESEEIRKKAFQAIDLYFETGAGAMPGDTAGDEAAPSRAV